MMVHMIIKRMKSCLVLGIVLPSEVIPGFALVLRDHSKLSIINILNTLRLMHLASIRLHVFILILSSVYNS